MSDTLHVLHTADLHLGRNRKYIDYLQQQRLMLDAIIAKLYRLLLSIGTESDVWFIVAGDVFDRNQDTKKDEFYLFLTGLVTPLLGLLEGYPNLRVFVIDGNHDRQPDIECPSLLTPLLGIVSHPRFHITLLAPEFHPETKMLSVPFGKKTEAEFQQLIAQYKPDFMIAHECLARIQTDMGFEPSRKQDHYTEIKNVLTPTLRGVFLGDIHRCQHLDEEGIVWYSGSPVTLDFGHCLPKGVLHHKFVRFEDRTDLEGNVKEWHWEQDGQPVLEPLADEAVRMHHKAGVITNSKDIPWDVLSKSNNAYVELVVTPEIFEEISAKMPRFFDSTTVSWSFHRAEIATVQVEDKAQSMEDYYKPLRDTWIDENLVNLPVDLREACKLKAQKDFEVRG